MSLDYYDRAGQPISLEEWASKRELPFDEYCRVAHDTIDDIRISTVWLGLDHSWTDEGPPIIFETMIFGGTLDGEMWRYPTEAEARAGHAFAVELVSLEDALA